MRVNTPLIMFAQFYDTDLLPFSPASVNIRVIMDGQETVAVGAQVGTSNVYSRTVTPTQVGMVIWRGETSDPGAVQPFTQWGAEWIISANAAPTLSEITTALQLGGVTLISPVTQSGQTMTIIIGDDYLSADGRAFTWSTAALTVDLTDAVIMWRSAVGEFPMTYDNDTVVLEVSRTVTAELVADSYPFAIQATLDSGSVVTLLTGVLRVVSEYGQVCGG